MSRDNDQSKDQLNQQSTLMFRDEALSYISAPQDMNKLVMLTRPYTWLLLSVFIALTCMGIGWSIKGRIPITLQGQGILVPIGSTFESVTSPEGTHIIQKISVRMGDFVKKDQLIVELDNPELKRNILDREHYIQTLKSKIDSLQNEAEASNELKAENYNKQREEMKRGIEEKNNQQHILEDYLEKKRAFLKKGYATLPDILNLENNIHNLKQEIRRSREQLLQLDQDENNHKEAWQQRIRDLKLKLGDEERDFENLIAKKETNQVIKSPLEGTVLNIHKNVGDRVLVNDSIMTISKNEENFSSSSTVKSPNDSSLHPENSSNSSQKNLLKDLEALVYFNPLEGKEIKEGMSVYVIPSYLDKEHRGAIEGKIRSVSTYPETAKSLTEALQNEELVKKFTESNPPISAKVTLDFNTTKSQHLTKSVMDALTPGTWVFARVVVKERSPLSLVIPEIKKILGMQQ